MSEVYSFSRLKVYDVCPRLYYYDYVLKLPREPVNFKARYGTYMVDEPICMWYKDNSYYPDFKGLWDTVAPTAAELKDKRNKGYTAYIAEIMFNEYTTRYQHDERYTIEQVQPRLMVYVGGYDYVSIPDLIFRDTHSGLRVVADLKTSGWDLLLDSAAFNQQFLGQLYAADARSHMVILFNVQSVTIERHLTQVTDKVIDKWWEAQRHRIAAVTRSHALRVWPQNAPDSCFRMGGPCPRLQQCQQST